MLDGAFSFRGRIGRLNYFLAGLVMIPAIVVVALLLAFVMAGASRGLASLVFFGVVVLLLAIVAGWYSLSLYVRRIRDIGWDPFTVLVGWFMIGCADVVLAKIVPAMALGANQTGTAIGALVNLGLTLALWFWPGRDGDVGGDVDTRRLIEGGPTRLDMLGSSRFAASEPLAAAAPARMPAGAPQGFGRRGLR